MTKELWVVGMALLLAGCGNKPKAAPDIENNSSGNPVTAPVDYLGAVAKAKKTAIKGIDKAQLTQAIERFHAMEDRYPKDLNELVKEHYLAEVPAAPYGTKITYNPATGEVGFVRVPTPPPQ